MKVRQIAWIAGIWTLAGALDALNTDALAGSDYLEHTGAYDFHRYFWVTSLAAFFSGIFSGSLLLFFLRERLRARSFGFAILVNSLLISALNFGFSALAYDIFLSLQFEEHVWDPHVIAETRQLLQSGLYFKNLVFWSIITFLTIIFLHVNDKYGPGMLGKLLLGRYHSPREEERIFMFADIRSSTTLAEKLGHIRFFNLLNDYYRDLTNAIIDNSGEIYQYVGDEIVISWPIEQGVANANCIRCFYAMQDTIMKKALRYREKYGVVPEFKAGLHCGMVTIGEIGVIKKDIVFSGDVLNTTSRIQNLCNKHEVKILLSKYLLDKLSLPPHDYHPHRVGIIALKGKQQKMELYTFLQEDQPLPARPLLATT